MLQPVITYLRTHPRSIWGIVLASVFGAEFLLMLALPWTIPKGAPRWIESTLDAIVLTLILAPLLWWTVLRPLVEVGRLRDRFLRDLFSSIENERRWIAHELHDSVGQSLTLLVSGLRSAHESISVPDVAERCRKLQDLAQLTLNDVKRLTLGLRPSLLDDLGLAPAVERLADNVQHSASINVSVDVTSVVGKRFDGPLETAVYRIAQESLTNIVKHSRATQASIRIHHSARSLQLVIEDNGCGISEDRPDGQLLQPSGHLGLVGMRERSQLLGGDFRVERVPTGGTRISATFPLGAPAT